MVLTAITIIFGIIGIIIVLFKKNDRIYCLIPFIFAVLSFIASVFPSNSATEDTKHHDTYEVTTTDTTTKTTSQSSQESLASTEEPTITNGTISGAITQEDQQQSFSYTALTTGRYHFDFEYSNVNNPFWFSILDSTGNCILESSSSKDEGVSVNLNENEIYHICIDEYRGLLENYLIKINEPTASSEIEGNSFSDSLTYIDQINTKYYRAPITGTYRFTFDISNINNSFHFYINDSKMKEIANTHSSEGVTVELIKDELYTITIEEYNGLLDSYSILIGIPNEPTYITEKQFGGSIDYIDQTNIYYYTAPRTGKYRFDFDSSNVNNSFYFYMYDSKKEKIAQRLSDNGGISLDLAKGETYEIHINEYQGLLDNYSVYIGVPKKIKTISSFPISGNLTYTDQCDTYKFTAPYSGEYNFEFFTNDVNCNYNIIVTAENEEEILYTNSDNSPKKVELNQNETYKFKVIQHVGYPVKYKIILN